MNVLGLGCFHSIFILLCGASRVVEDAQLLWRFGRVTRHVVGPLHEEDLGHDVDEDLADPGRHLVR